MKRCNLCLIAKPFEAFRRRKDSADGLSHRCKDCLKIAEDAWRHRNKERANSSRKAWAKNNPEKRKATLARYFSENQEKERLRAVEYRAKNRLKTNAAAANWSRNNRGARNAITARRRAAKLLRTPKWLTDADYLEMRLIYEFAQCVEIATGGFRITSTTSSRSRVSSSVAFMCRPICKFSRQAKIVQKVIDGRLTPASPRAILRTGTQRSTPL